MSVENIPNKVIHYCWFGGNPLSELTKKCIATWKKYLPDFEIKEWNESTFDVNSCEFVKQAYEQKKWAFVADYTRFKVLEQEGGLYLDTDMEITADIAKYLEHDLFMGQEDSKLINAAVVWVKEKNNKHIHNIVESYEKKEEFNPIGNLYKESVPQVLTEYFEKFGFDKEKDEIQVLDNESAYIYPMEYFYPLSYDHRHNKFTDNSCMIHHFDATWITPMEKFKTEMKRKNMKWVVHIIDFFINTKNFILTYINYRDISIFVTTFLIIFLTTCSLQPIYKNINNTLFNSINNKFGIIVFCEFLFSVVWTYICKNIRTIEINELMDINITKKEGNNYRIIHVNDEKKKAILRYENIIFSVEILLSIILLMLPVSYLINIISLKSSIFAFSIISIIFMIYVGIKKKMQYRILDLLFISLFLTIMFITGIPGMIISILTFTGLLLAIFVSKISKKRMLVYIASYIVIIVATLVGSLLFNYNLFKDNNLSFSISNFTNFGNIYNNYTVNFDYISNFNFGKNILEVIYNIVNILNIPIVLLILSIISNVLLCIISKKYKYLTLVILPIIVNLVLTNVIEVAFINFVFMTFSIVLLFVYILRKIYKNEKFKMM